MQVKFGSNEDVGANNVADAVNHVGFTVVIAIGNHGAMKGEQHDVYRHGGLQVGQHFITQGFVDGAGGDAGRLGKGKQPHAKRPAALLAFLIPDVNGVAIVAALAIDNGVGWPPHDVVGEAGGERGESIGFGHQTAGKNVHGGFLLRMGRR